MWVDVERWRRNGGEGGMRFGFCFFGGHKGWEMVRGGVVIGLIRVGIARCVQLYAMAVRRRR